MRRARQNNAAAITSSGRVTGSGTAETPAVSVGVGEPPDVIAAVPVPEVGRSISRNESRPFGFVVGISLP